VRGLTPVVTGKGGLPGSCGDTQSSHFFGYGVEIFFFLVTRSRAFVARSRKSPIGPDDSFTSRRGVGVDCLLFL